MKAKLSIASTALDSDLQSGVGRVLRMRNGNGDALSLFGVVAEVEVDRALTELRAGRPIRIVDRDRSIVALPVEALTDDRLAAFRRLCAPTAPRLIVSETRAEALGLDATSPMAITLAPDATAADIVRLVCEQDAEVRAAAEPAGIDAAAAIEMVKLVYGLPAVIAADAAGGLLEGLLSVNAASVTPYREALLRSLVIAGEARVPLADAAETRFVVFRDITGSNSVAVVIGKPDLSAPVPVRMHSACLTGDVFGSRRCDCGDQLHLAISRIEASGGGVVLYLAQEGRGLGLVNKMRAYELQDDGLDTIDANTTLGFDDDERDYGIAGRMLEMLGITHVHLMTNNPAKLKGLTHAGIHVACRMPIEAPVNADNWRYLTAKAERAGHKLDHLLAAIHGTRRSPETVP